MTRTPTALYVAGFTSLVLSGAIFGFFYAWICSTMWGLDAADPRVAITAMQAMNASVRNIVFAPAFFGTGPVLLVTAGLALAASHRPAVLVFAAAGLVYVLGGTVLTMAINVPMNEALGATPVPDTAEAAALIWADYSPRWQVWNTIRTVASGISLLLTGVGVFLLGRGTQDNSAA
ncbi:anthrone oxygenase family protein [Rhodalgimonas zhirmunskyi]|uniref:DUF1772 domain-containing protein n=1 Tax=Rhodalgimonas zhirmunskyi TaxID=2964767 RepID=A0AAJ1UE55_9RHOB|nr:anthrone oxygenase family protein [Rhodoalgimonas zhirmunskyi]MDQ2095838.1 DUF1772 domain-containing protein [Rhodoalgimonas zhirmunskyi]